MRIPLIRGVMGRGFEPATSDITASCNLFLENNTVFTNVEVFTVDFELIEYEFVGKVAVVCNGSGGSCWCRRRRGTGGWWWRSRGR